MKPNDKKKNQVLQLVLIMLLLTVGCVDKKVSPAVTRSEPSCRALFDYGISTFSDEDIVAVLEGENPANEACQIKLIKLALDANREIPLKYLKESIYLLNKKRHETHFHKAVHCYLDEIVKGNARYGDFEQEVLEKYCSFVINRAETRNDMILGKTKLLCNRLDSRLYTKFFE